MTSVDEKGAVQKLLSKRPDGVKFDSTNKEYDGTVQEHEGLKESQGQDLEKSLHRCISITEMRSEVCIFGIHLLKIFGVRKKGFDSPVLIV
jgi:hypothetical protein